MGMKVLIGAGMLNVACSTVLNMSVTAGAVIVFVLLVRMLLKRAPKIFSYALWAVVLFRLLCPVSISSELSLLKWLDVPAESRGGRTSVTEYISPEDIELGQSDEAPLMGSQQMNPDIDGDGYAEKQGRQNKVFEIAAVIWLAGIVGMVVYSLISYHRLRKTLVGAINLGGNIYLADYITSPFVVGLFRPQIYLPSNLSEHEQEYIIMHEKHHIRRGDHIIKLLAFATLGIHWFNPLVWVAFVLAGKDMEMSCDEAVIGQMSRDIRADYSASLLNLSTGHRVIAGMPLAFGEGDTKGRIKNLARWKKPKVWVSVIGILICVLIIVGLFTNPMTYVSQIRINGINYVLQEETVSKLPDVCYEMGELESVVHRTRNDPEKDYSGTNLDEKYPGCMIYQEYGVTDVIYLEDYSGFYLVFKSELASPFHHSWRMEDIVFNVDSSYPYPKEHAPIYSLHYSGEFSLVYGDVGIIEGTFEPYALSEKKFDGFFDWSSDRGVWTDGEDMSPVLREENAYAWKLDIEYPRSGGDQTFYYLLQQKNGDVYLAHGYYDSQGPNDSFADDTYINWMIRLEQQ